MNLLMKRLGANVTLPIMVILWGVVCTCQGIGDVFLPHFAVFSAHACFRCCAFLPQSSRVPFPSRHPRRYSILAYQRSSRFIDDLSSGGLFPGIALLLSNFYKRHAMQLRFAMMFSVTSLAGAFSGLIAYGIRNLNGKHGIAGWQWIFIVVRRLLHFVPSERILPRDA